MSIIIVELKSAGLAYLLFFQKESEVSQSQVVT